MELKRENLIKALNKVVINLSPQALHNINNLMYTAEETGLIEYRVDEKDLIILLRIVKLSEILAGIEQPVPDELRM